MDVVIFGMKLVPILVIAALVSAEKENEIPSPIIVGKIAKPGEFPYQALLNITSSDGVSRCGGTLISKWFVLTAAHCFDE